ncbi:uncharacterized protein MONBRDRAFT_27984 [Monosiga brevicollis MX1]|uniref:UBC core domain-containing protein n=1 Tax=Monosiga brevicollis TaxID=81824 RepID=A9V6V7_MONBE|nr:uncharacterized protein MONBRDRAFT_27984 [Monosiga brevicollis MX1]EDQ86611.1 predicted protein [Monosiga brevicollis MX1]|eukprot:XP_001748447.1 hypothetical protein [Monosiga brevicollis MX1]
MLRQKRLAKEYAMLQQDPPPGVLVWTTGQVDTEARSTATGGDGSHSTAPAERLDQLTAQITGPADSPYRNGVFKLEIKVPDMYPLQPPQVRFLTRVYHPNIDRAGRICLDLLKMPPKGSWGPASNLATLLTSLRVPPPPPLSLSLPVHSPTHPLTNHQC